jgi:hypothetical protein
MAGIFTSRRGFHLADPSREAGREAAEAEL